MPRIILKNSNTLEKRPDPASLVNGEVALNVNSGSPGLFFKDSSGKLVKAGPTAYSSTAPNAIPPSGGFSGNCTGELWFDTSTNSLKIYNGSTWIPTYTQSNLVGLTTNSITSFGVGANTTAQPNVAVGVNAGNRNASNGQSVNIGHNARAGGSSSVVIGYSACSDGSPNSVGNVIVGFEAGKFLTADRATVVGYQAGQNLTAGATAYGYQALQSATAGDNTAFGRETLKRCTTGTKNIAIGNGSLDSITTGSGNTVIGENAGTLLNGAASNNTIIGLGAGFQNVSNGNICIGLGTGSYCTGNNNILIGNDLNNLGSISNNTVIGRPSASISGVSNQVILCDGSGNIRLRFNENGALQVNGSYGGSGAFLQSQGSGAPPRWTVGATGSFIAHDGSTVIVENGMVSQVI